MNIIEEYLKRIQELGYGHPIQTRPKPELGITKEKPKKKDDFGTRGPSGAEVDLDEE